MMKLVCKSNFGLEQTITKGKVYVITGYNNVWVTFENDLGKTSTELKSRFTTIEKYREIKLKLIGI